MKLFLFLLILASLSALTAGGVAIAVHFFHVDAAPWTDFSAWNSRPVLTGGLLVLFSWFCSSVLTAMWRLVVGLLGGGSRQRKRAPRPQSNRRTTV